MDDDPLRALSTLRKRRGVIRGSITRLGKRLRELEATPTGPEVGDGARQSATKLETLDKDYKSLHFDVVDLIDDEEMEELEKEQEVLDKHDDDVASIALRLQQLISKSGSPADTIGVRKSSSRKLSRLERSLNSTEEALSAMGEGEGHSNIPLLEQYREQLIDYKREIAAVYEDFTALDLEDEDELILLHARLEKIQFGCSLRVKRLLSSHDSHSASTSTTVNKGVKLPKLKVPTFDGDVLHWKQFWEQFAVSVHDHSVLSNAEKLVYLQQAIKDGSAKSVVEGLSRSGEQYQEAIDCLKSRYNRPRVTHRAHVRMIVDAPPLKEGSGKELRRLHDTLQQHLRALKSMKHEPDGSFITSIVELKLDPDTMFEWSKHSQDKTEEVPHYMDILEFIDLRAQASESSLPASTKKLVKGDPPSSKRSPGFSRTVTTFATNSHSVGGHCVLCVSEQHPLYVCPKFKLLSHDDRLSTLKRKNLCINCLGGGHYIRQCRSSQRCKKCQRPHHTLLHSESHNNTASNSASSMADSAIPPTQPQVTSNTAVKLKSSSLLMTCRVLVTAPDGTPVEARALLDNASSASFISERLVQSLDLPRVHQNVRVSGIAGSSPRTPIQSVASLQISAAHRNGRKINLTAIVVPKVTCNLPIYPVPFESSWSHISDLTLADPAFGQPGRIDVLLGVDVFVDVLLHGRRNGIPGSPVALETEFGWVLCGSNDQSTSTDHVNLHVTIFHAATPCSDDILRSFWEIEESPRALPVFSLEDRAVIRHFEAEHRRTDEGRFEVPLPRKPDAKQIGESRSQAVRRFFSLERSLNLKNQFKKVDTVVQEYFDLGHAEVVPNEDMGMDPAKVFYLPMHVVYKSSSTTTKVRAVFDASAKSSTGVSLNDTLVVGPTIHPSLIDVLLRFRLHHVALTADISKMYRAVELTKSDRDFHRFVWRSDEGGVLKDFRMTRATFGVSASGFAANMAVKQNAIDLAHEYPLAAKVVEESLYVDDCLTGADDVKTAITLHGQLQNLFSRGGFSNEQSVFDAIPPELREHREVISISDSNGYPKTLGLEWNTTIDAFYITISTPPPSEDVTKRILVSDIAKIFDVLGWFAPAIVSMKILLQRVWELGVDWDDPVPTAIHDTWAQWRAELPILSKRPIPRCYSPKEVRIVSTQLHGFSDASENAYAGVVYLRLVDSVGGIHTSLVISKTRVSPIKRLSIPRLELCGAEVLSRLLRHAKEVLHIPMSDVYAWTDSMIVLSWLTGNPRRFKTYVGNRVSSVVDQIPPDRWNHVVGSENPADCASRGLLPSELLNHGLWWNGPPWLVLAPSCWPKQPSIPVEQQSEEVREICLVTAVHPEQTIIPWERYSTFTRLQRVMAWILRFISNCRPSKHHKLESNTATGDPCLTSSELIAAERYLVKISQQSHFSSEITSLKAKIRLSSSSCVLSVHPFIDTDGVLRVGGRERNSALPYSRMHPIIIHGKHPLTKLIIRSEHLRLLHAGPTLVCSALTRRFHVIGMRKIVRSITRECVTCRRQTTRPQPQMLGQLPIERVTPGSVFEKVGVDYAGPLQVKYGMVRKPVTVKAYVCVFVSLSVKAVHLEAVSDLTSEAFVATLRRFIARRGCPSLIWSDNGTNFVGANRELRELREFLAQQKTGKILSDFCSFNKIEWRFIPEHGPNFGGLWEAAVKSTKTHLRRIVGNVKLTFEELTTVLAQIEACLNSRPLVSINSPDDDGIEVLTPGHFLIGHPLCALPDPSFSFRPISLLRRWHLCQNLVRHFWQRWSSEYLSSLNKINKWHDPSRNLTVGDVVILKEDGMIPTRWPLARVAEVHPGNDGLVRVATVKTAKGTYKRPITKIALLLPMQ